MCVVQQDTKYWLLHVEAFFLEIVFVYLFILFHVGISGIICSYLQKEISAYQHENFGKTTKLMVVA